jgi:hypothetical protein
MKKPCCILHIGMPKTGSSSIQDSLFNSNYIEGGEYLKVGKSSNHSTMIFSLFSNNPENHHAHKALGLNNNDIDIYNKNNFLEIKNAVSITSAKKIIISGEDILFLNEEELRKLKQCFSDLFSEILIFAYVRPPISFMQSAFQQKIKEGDLRFGISGFYPHYKKRFENFDKVFDKKNVNLIKFEKNNLYSNDVVLDFCHRVNISIEDKNLIRSNESLSLEAISFLFLFHKLNEKNNIIASEDNYRLAEIFTDFGKEKFQYSQDLILEIKKLISEDIRWMENRLECSLDEAFVKTENDISSENDLLMKSEEYIDIFMIYYFKIMKDRNLHHDFLYQLLNNLKNNEIKYHFFSRSQIAKIESPTSSINDIIKELLLSLGSFGYIKAADNIISKIINYSKNYCIQKSYSSNKITLIDEETDCINKIKILHSIDIYIDGQLKGWILDENNPLLKLHIIILQKTNIIAEGIANKYRRDLADSGIGDGFCSFSLKTKNKLLKSDGDITIRVADYEKDIIVNIESIKGV